MHLINHGHFAAWDLASFLKHIIQCTRAEAIDVLSDESLRGGYVGVRSVTEKIYLSSYKVGSVWSKDL